MDTKKILIVEDDEFLQSLASSKLEKEGFNIAMASDSEGALSIVKEDAIDLVLLDLVLPGNDGFNVLEELQSSEKSNIPVIVFSNLAEDKDISRAQELGATEFMIKSNFTLDELVDKIKSYLQ